ncbi:MAG: DUF1284 domain-containing protein [Alphaproteobacteria bacterium]|nr:DUF1284 domain-containing protein [Alphaproteobacteria bacterium]
MAGLTVSLGKETRLTPVPPMTFRPHHFLCALGYQGKGYDDAFTANMDEVVAKGLHQQGGDNTVITVTTSADVICQPCPHRRGQGCAKQAQIDALDARHAERLELKAGDELSWGAAKARIAAKVKSGDLSELCAGCGWLEAGMCEAALARLLAQSA